MKPIIPFEPIRSDTIPSGPQWTYQIKWDGVRVLAYCDGSGTDLFNRRLNKRNGQYPELLRPFLAAESYIVDGEVIALAEDGKPSFHEVMRRDGIRRLERVPQAMAEVPITYMIFDLLYLNGEWTTDRPLRERRNLLQKAILPNPAVQLVQSHEDGPELFAVIRQHGMEGIVCKNLDSAYSIGGKDDRWAKIKNYGDITAVIGGFTLRDGTVNAVLAGVYHEDKLYFIGKVGTGKLTAADWRDLTAELTRTESAECPFANKHPDMRGARWTLPRLTAKIQFTEWRWREGRTMRHPSLQAFVSVPPKQCMLDTSP